MIQAFRFIFPAEKTEAIMLKKVFIVIFLLSGFTAAAHGDTFNLKLLEKHINESMIGCPARIWPSYDWTDKAVVLLSTDQKAYQWLGSRGSFKVFNDGIPDALSRGVYSFQKFLGHDAVLFNVPLFSASGGLKDLNSLLFQVIIHEGFHRFAQPAWKRQQSALRGTSYPVSYLPRLYRRYLFDNIKRYFLSGGEDKEALAFASTWFMKWKSEFPDEVNRSEDQMEGTAEYIQLVAGAVGDLGCGATLNEIKLLLTNKYLQDLRSSVAGTKFSLDAEGYDIGAIAGLSLFFVNNDQSWFGLVQAGSTPPNVLLEGQAALPVSIDPSLEAQFRLEEVSENKKLDGWLKNDVARFADKSAIKIVIPFDSMGASFRPQGFYLPKALPNITAIPLAADQVFKSISTDLIANVGQVIFQGASPCESGGFIIVPPVATVKLSTDNLRAFVQSAYLNGRISGVLKSVESELWFCGSQ
jgi:hypothetical protein